MNNSPEELGHLLDWWRRKSEEAFSRTAPKAIEYGSRDLEAMAAMMTIMMPALRDQPPELAVEAALCFYMMGKVARAFSAIERGLFPNVDCYFDAEVYAKMAQYVREHGAWV